MSSDETDHFEPSLAFGADISEASTIDEVKTSTLENPGIKYTPNMHLLLTAVSTAVSIAMIYMKDDIDPKTMAEITTTNLVVWMGTTAVQMQKYRQQKQRESKVTSSST